MAQTERGISPVVVLLRWLGPEAMATLGGDDEAVLYERAALFERYLSEALAYHGHAGDFACDGVAEVGEISQLAMPGSSNKD